MKELDKESDHFILLIKNWILKICCLNHMINSPLNYRSKGINIMFNLKKIILFQMKYWTFFAEIIN